MKQTQKLCLRKKIVIDWEKRKKMLCEVESVDEIYENDMFFTDFQLDSPPKK